MAAHSQPATEGVDCGGNVCRAGAVYGELRRHRATPGVRAPHSPCKGMDAAAAAAPAPTPEPEKARADGRRRRLRASEVRRYIHDELYPHMLAAVQAANRTQPSQPVLYVAHSLLGAEEEARALVPADGANGEGAVDVQRQVQAAMQEAITACVREDPLPADPVAFVGNFMLALA